jgi:hypothetical protein
MTSRFEEAPMTEPHWTEDDERQAWADWTKEMNQIATQRRPDEADFVQAYDGSSLSSASIKSKSTRSSAT